MDQHTIYIIEDHRNKLYVGVTSESLEKRLRKHKTAANRGIDTHLYRAMRKYGTDRFEIIPLDVAPTNEDAYELEKEWIKNLGTYVDWGYNSNEGGRGFPSGKKHPMYGRDRSMSEETKRKMSKSTRGENHPNSDLSRKDASEVKYLALHSEMDQTEIGNLYGTSRQTVSAIKREKAWRTVKAQKPS